MLLLLQLRPGIITDKLNNAIATGNWGRGTCWCYSIT